ncbi:MAG: hypothetical protein WC488_04365 [Candidatus Micrarchaeia archaeon]
MRTALAFLLILALLHPEVPSQVQEQASQTFTYIMMIFILAALILFALKHADFSKLFPQDARQEQQEDGKAQFKRTRRARRKAVKPRRR